MSLLRRRIARHQSVGVPYRSGYGQRGHPVHVLSNSNMAIILTPILVARQPSGLAMVNLVVADDGARNLMEFGDTFSKRRDDRPGWSGRCKHQPGEFNHGCAAFRAGLADGGGMADQTDPAKLRRLQESDVEMLLVNGTDELVRAAHHIGRGQALLLRKAQMALLPNPATLAMNIRYNQRPSSSMTPVTTTPAWRTIRSMCTSRCPSKCG